MHRAAVDEAVIDLVGDHEQVVALGNLRQRLQRRPVQHRAGRIRGIAEAAAPWSPIGVIAASTLSGSSAKPRTALVSTGTGAPPCEQYRRRVGGVGRIGDDHLVAEIDNRSCGEVQTPRRRRS